jgi:hypothetical protein
MQYKINQILLYILKHHIQVLLNHIPAFHCNLFFFKEKKKRIFVAIGASKQAFAYFLNFSNISTKQSNKYAFAAIILSLLSSCVNNNFNPPNVDCIETTLSKTKEVEELYAISIPNPTTPYGYSETNPNLGENDVIEAYVVSSDEGGNFFKTISLVALDNSRGFSIAIDATNLYTQKLEPGRKVYLKLKNLYHALSTSGSIGLTIGGAPAGTFNTLGRIPEYEYKKYLFPSCTIVNEETLVKPITIAQINDSLINNLVEINNVQFTDAHAGGTYVTTVDNKPNSNTIITNGTDDLLVRTSPIANFSGYKVPTGNGKIRGVLSKFGNTFQLLLRTDKDVNMNNPRIILPSSPLGGTEIAFLDKLSEPFTSYEPATNTFPKYINDQTIGNKYWSVKNFSNNNFIEMSAFGGSGITAKSYFIVPVNFTAASTFTFKKSARFNKGEVLRIYYVKSEDFSNGFLNKTPFVDITSSFTLTYPLLNESEKSFTNAGNYNIPENLTGNGYFVFEYSGTPAVTTTMQIDDIVIE